MTISTKEQVSRALQLHQAGNFSEAEILYSEILKAEPENANTLNLLGLLKLQMKQFEDSISYIKKAVAIQPCAYYFESLGRAYFENNNLEEAISSYEKALQFSPNDFDILFYLALAYKKNKQFDKAISVYESALVINPNHADLYFNIANAYENKNDTYNALKYYQKALGLNIQKSDIEYFVSTSLLKLKNFEDGWKYYEYRPSKNFAIITHEKQYKEMMFSKPIWNGESLDNKTLFIYYEAGLGDSIMYARYIPFIKEKWPTCKILYRPQSNLASLFRESGIDADIIDIKTPENEVIFDTHVPIMTLPCVLQHNHESDIPFADGFIKANPQKVEEYKEKYFDNDNFKIGIKWQGNPAYDRNRIIPIDAFFKLFNLPNTKFYSLQKDDGAEELAKLPENFELINLGPTFNDFSDTAAAIENLDLVICNDTSVAHLVCAMGKPCWIMLPFVSNWRWHMDYSYSPWYKSAKLFKQEKLDDWDGAFDEALQILKEISK